MAHLVWTLLSLGKLAALASNDRHEGEIRDIDAELDIVMHHEQLPRELIHNLNLNEDDLPCMIPQQLIEMYVCDKNTSSNEYDFKKALDLLHYIQKDSSVYSSLKLRIWCRAILKDNWNEMQGVDPGNFIKNSIFFKTVLLAYQEGLDLSECLPDRDSLVQNQELSEMRDSVQFQYLLQTGFEQIGRMLDAE